MPFGYRPRSHPGLSFASKIGLLPDSIELNRSRGHGIGGRAGASRVGFDRVGPRVIQGCCRLEHTAKPIHNEVVALLAGTSNLRRVGRWSLGGEVNGDAWQARRLD